jgi:diguanylate cyclase (GGDEF)-like protein/PAS domain S-box-containing protein
MIDRAATAEGLSKEQERAQCTLDSIGDAVVSTDVEGCVSYLNSVAERFTGYTREEAVGQRIEEVFRVVDAETRTIVPISMVPASRQSVAVKLSPHFVLLRRDGFETAIEYSAAPIRDSHGQARGAVMVFYDVSKARALSSMNCLAQHDPLTNLPGRALLNDRLGQAIGLARENDSTLAILYLNLDFFSHINASFGHAGGDRLLQSAARRFGDCMRASDTVSRLGADEFVILLPEVVHPRDAAICAEKILQAMRVPYVLDERERLVTASIGIAIYPDDGTDAESLLESGNRAMRDAKDRGRNGHKFCRSELNSRAAE